MFDLLKGRLVIVRSVLLIATLTLTIIGILTIYAVGNPAQTGSTSQPAELANFWKKQVAFAIMGFITIVGVNLVSYRRLGQAAYWIYAIVGLLLALPLIDKFVDLPFVPVINNARRWLRLSIGPMSLNIQPSEIFKPVYVLALAWYLRYRSNYRNFLALLGPFLLTLVPTALILLEPDLGTVLLMMPVFFAMLFIAGVKVKHLAMILLLALLISPLMWHKMQPYQRIRISSVLLQSDWLREKAEKHPALSRILVGATFSERRWKNNWGYHLTRSKYAVASGGATGYGFRGGPFVKYNIFLPERHNDFIFAIIAHQWGFIGCIAVLGLYVILLWCGLEIAVANTDPFGRLLAAGIVAMFAIQVIVNVTMTIGLMPITGLTLPLVSYGGSSLLASALCAGLLNNVGRRRPFTVAPRR